MPKTMTIAPPAAQINFFAQGIVDNFAGGGGASTGIELAIGQPVTLAINHDKEAIRMHRTNHPYTKHLCESVWNVDPMKELPGMEIALVWASPDCRHHSRAKGGKPVEKNIRGLAWVMIRWMLLRRPRVIMLENVEEIMSWGPLIAGPDGKEYPDPDRRGETFDGFLQIMSTGIEPGHPAFLECCEFLELDPDCPLAQNLVDGLGYEVQHRKLVAADYGTPTIRKRFFLVGRCDGQDIVWPEPTHGHPDSEEVKNGTRKPWRTAAEIIDWSLECPSIFDTKEEIKKKHGVNAVRPLKPKTLQRIARGLDKFVIKNADPYIINCNHGGDGYRGQSIHDPLDTITAKHGYGVVMPYMTCIGQNGFSPDRSRSILTPLNTTVTKAEQCLAAATLIQYHTEQNEGEHRGQDMNYPLLTVDAANRYGLVSCKLAPLPPPPSFYCPPLAPSSLQEAFVVKNYGGGYTGAGSDLRDPLGTITGVDHNALAVANLVKFQQNSIGQHPSEPIHTVMAGATRFGLMYSNLVVFRNNMFGQSPMEPLKTIATSPAHFGLSRYFLMKYYGQGTGQTIHEPLHTITTKDRLVAINVKLVRADYVRDLKDWDRVRRFLNEYGGYNLAEDEILLFNHGGIFYYISDIGLRMLSPRELFLANGFPADYIIDRDDMGVSYGKANQVARCGNAVPPQLVEALVRANLADLCGERIDTMQELEERIAI